MVTSETAANVGNAQYATTGLSINLSFGGSAYLQNCLFDESYNNFTQGQNLTIKNVGMVIMPLLVEIYNLIIDGFAITQGGTYRRFYSTFWFTRDSRSNIGGLVLSYCNNAVMNDLYLSSQSFHVASPAFPLKLDFCKDVTLTNYRAVNITPLYNAINSCALYLYSSNNCTITGIEAYGIGAVFLSFSSNNTISNITWAEHVQFNSAGYTMTGDRLGYDPVTGSDLIEGQKYYIKLRTYHDRKREIYWDSKTYSFTPFLGAQLFPDYFACNCTVSQTVVWTNRSPVYLYEVFRSTALGFGTRDLTTLMYASTVAATVAFTNGPVTQAIPTAVTDTWTWNAAGKTLTRSAGTGTSFLTLGFILGMVVDVTETASNNGTFILSACTATVMTFANVGPYTQTIVAEAAAVIGKINGRTPANDTTYYYVLRKWDDAATSNESAETEVTPTANISSQNLIIQSDAFNTTWVAARITVTANQTSPFTTPLEVKVSFTENPDSVIKIQPSQSVQNFQIDVNKNKVSGLTFDPQNWVLDSLLYIYHISQEVAQIELDDFFISLGPNPASDNLHFKYSGPDNFEGSIKLYDLTGKELICYNIKSNQENIPLIDLKTGIYLAEIKGNHIHLARKLIIIK